MFAHRTFGKKYIPVTQITLKLVRLPVWCTICFFQKKSDTAIGLAGWLRAAEKSCDGGSTRHAVLTRDMPIDNSDTRIRPRRVARPKPAPSQGPPSSPRLHVRTSHTETPERRHACPRHLRDRLRLSRDHRRRPIQFSWIGSRHRPRGRIQRDVLGPSQGQFPRRGRLRGHHTRCRRITRGRPRRQGGLRHRPLLLRAGRLGDNSDPRRSRRGSRGDARQRHVHREQRHDPGHRDDNRRR